MSGRVLVDTSVVFEGRKRCHEFTVDGKIPQVPGGDWKGVSGCRSKNPQGRVVRDVERGLRADRGRGSDGDGASWSSGRVLEGWGHRRTLVRPSDRTFLRGL